MNIDAAIAGGLKFLAGQQKASGGFNSFSSSSRRQFKPEYTYQTTFVPSLVLSSLATINLPAAVVIRNRLTKFLLNQKSPHWTYNYWTRQSVQAAAQPYSDDLDDTFCALAALVSNNPKAASADMLAAAVKILLAAETKPGGPYRTWLVSPDSQAEWLDTDIAVNANIAYFLSLASQPIQPLTAWLDRAVAGNQPRSPYYPSAIPLIYYLARGYSGQHAHMLIKKTDSLLTRPLNSLESALLISSLKRLGAKPPENLIKKLLNSQTPDGAWPAEAFCIDPSLGGKTFYHGAEVLTTAFVLEALELSRQTTSTPDKLKNQLIIKVLNLAKADMANTDRLLKKDLLNFMQRVAEAGNGAEIIGLPVRFSSDLKSLPKRAEKYQYKLALANLYGWTAYTIYDDLLDQEGDSNKLPLANLAMRRSLLLFQDNGTAEWQKFVSQTFDSIDAANLWEAKSCRWQISGNQITVGKLPAYRNLEMLAEKSLGHMLGPVCILQLTGYGPTSSGSRHVQRALKHYLVARQLNDDLHDWQDDLRRGQITYVVAKVLQESSIRPGRYNINNLSRRLQQHFWNHTLRNVCLVMRRQVVAGRRELARCQLLKSENVITKLLDGLEASIKETLTSQAAAREFLEKYKN